MKKKLKNPLYPLQIIVKIQFYKLKNKKIGKIYKFNDGVYIFYSFSKSKKNYIQLFKHQIKQIFNYKTKEIWDFYE